MKRAFAWLTIVGLIKSWAWAGAIPSQITYQGTLKEQGVPVNGTRTMLFRLTSSDGTTVYWSSANTDVTVTQGLFAAVLSPTGVDWQNATPYIELNVNGQILLPREPITSNAYSMMSGTVVDGAITTPKIANGAVTTANLANGAVTTPILGNGAVTTANIADGAVTTQQLAGGAVTSAIIANQGVTTANLANGAVTTAQLAAGSVTSAQLDPSVQLITVPSGMIAMFASACPNGWSRFSALDNAFPMGSATYGTSGGSATAATGRGVVFGSGQGSGSFQTSWVNGDLTLQNQAVSILPPYLTMVYCIKS